MSGRSALKSEPCGTGRLSTMIVIMIATTPSVKAFSRSGFIGYPRERSLLQPDRRAMTSRLFRLVRRNRRLRLHPFDQFVELDGLLGCGESIIRLEGSYLGV